MFVLSLFFPFGFVFCCCGWERTLNFSDIQNILPISYRKASVPLDSQRGSELSAILDTMKTAGYSPKVNSAPEGLMQGHYTQPADEPMPQHGKNNKKKSKRTIKALFMYHNNNNNNISNNVLHSFHIIFTFSISASASQPTISPPPPPPQPISIISIFNLLALFSNVTPGSSYCILKIK